MVRLQKLYSKFKAIESGRAVTEVTKGSYCSRTRIVGVSRRPLEHRSLCSTWSQAFFGLTSPSCASTQGERGVRRPRQTGHAHRRTMDFMLFRHAWAKAGSAAAWAMYSRPTTAYRTFSPDRGRFFSVRRPVYGESRSGFVWLLPLLPPRHGRLLH